MIETNNLELLQEENDKLKQKNDKLYKDCVSFAKRIKALENIESRLDDLEKENEELKAEIARLSSTERPAEYVVQEPTVEETVEYEEPVFNSVPEVSSVEETQSFSAAYVPQETVSTPQVSFEPIDATKSIPTNHSTHKYNPLITIIRTFLWIIFIVSLIVGLISSICYIFSTNYADYSIAGYRFAVVRNNAMAPEYRNDAAILIKYQDFDGIPIDSIVVTTKDHRSVGKLTSIDLVNGQHLATISDKSGTYTVNSKQFIGCVVLKVPYVGHVVSYACANQYNYLAICVSAILVSLALILLIPSNKSRAPKFGKDYGVEEFTI